MSHSPNYINAEDFKASVSIPGTVKNDDVNMAIGAASRAIERVVQRRFWLDETDFTRTYTALNSSFVDIDDLAELTSVTSSGTDITDDVTPHPLNASADMRPFTSLRSDGDFSTNLAAITVTGRFGWPEIPEQVPQIVTIVASKLLKRTREAPFGIVSTGGIEGTSIRITRDDPDLQLLVGALKRNYPPVA